MTNIFTFQDKRFIKSKRAQIAETITWFIGFVIIFFIVMIFMFITIALANKSAVTPEANKVINSESNQELIFYLLDSKIIYHDEKVPLKKLISEYCNGDETLKEPIKKEFMSKLEKYYFKIEISKEDLTKLSIQHQNEEISATYQYAPYPNYVVQPEFEMSIINCDKGKIRYKFENKNEK